MNYKEPLPSVAGGITRGNNHGFHLEWFRLDKKNSYWKVQRMMQTWMDSPGRFSRLCQTKARLPWCSGGGSPALRGKLNSVTLLQAKIFISFWFSLLKAPGILRYTDSFEHCTQRLKLAFTQDLSESQQTNKQHYRSTVILYWQQPHKRFFTVLATELLNPRREALGATSRGA